MSASNYVPHLHLSPDVLILHLFEKHYGNACKLQASNLVFYGQSTVAVISGRSYRRRN